MFLLKCEGEFLDYSKLLNINQRVVDKDMQVGHRGGTKA